MLKTLALFAPAVILAAGCSGGDDEDQPPVCQGHSGEGCAVALTDPDGGQVRIENLMLPDGQVHPLIHAHFIEVTGANETFMGPGKCWDVRATNYFPFGSDMMGGVDASYIVPSRKLADMGDTVQVVGTTGTIVMNKVVNKAWITGSGFSVQYLPTVSETDPYGWNFYDDDLIGGNGENPAVTFDIVGIPGVTAEEGKGVLTVPSRPKVQELIPAGTMALPGVPAPTWELTRGEGLTVKWVTGRAGIPDKQIVILYIFGASGPNLVCLEYYEVGQFALTAQEVGLLEDMGTMFLQHINHVLVPYETAEGLKRLDAITTACTSTNFAKVDP